MMEMVFKDVIREVINLQTANTKSFYDISICLKVTASATWEQWFTDLLEGCEINVHCKNENRAIWF